MTAMVNKETSLPLRNDTLLGVCEALGQDFGINATWFRLVFIAPLFFAPLWTVAAYLGLGAVVAASRYFYPRVTLTQVEAVEPVAAQTVDADYRIAA